MALDADMTFPDVFEVWEVRFRDSMGELFDIHVRGASTNAAVALSDFIGTAVTLSLHDEPLLPEISGIVRRAVRGTTEPSGMTVYDVYIAPREWLLTRRTNCRIFKNKTAPEIVDEIAQDHPGLAIAHRRIGAYPAREYTVQYDETDYDFVRRVLAEEGIGFYYDPSSPTAWTLVDSTSTMAPDIWPTVEINPSNLKPGTLAAMRHWEEKVIATARAVVRSYDEENPFYVLQGTDEAPAHRRSANEASLEDFSYQPGRFSADGDGNDQAQRTVVRTRSDARFHRLETNFAAPAGTLLRIADAPLANDWIVLGSETLLRSAPQTADGPGGTERQIRLTIQLHRVPFRLPYRKKPRIFGTQIARVIGETPLGTVDVDARGRVFLKFRWDRSDRFEGQLTRRVRVSQAWAGPGYGFVTLPRVGDEVVVAYNEGDPDEPIVIGRVHNAVSVTPLDLPAAQKTLTIWKSQSFGPGGPVDGYNAIAMDDACGAEVLGVKAQRDLVALIGRNATTTIQADETTTIGGDQTLLIAGNQTIQVGGKRSGGSGGGGGTSVKGDLSMHVSGDYSLTVDGSLSLKGKTVDVEGTEHVHIKTGGERLDKSANHLVRANAMYIQTGDVTQITGPRLHVFCDEIVLQAGASVIEVTKGGIKIESPGVVDVKGSIIKLNS